MTWAERLRVLHVEADHLYRRMQAHYEACGCWDRLFKNGLNYKIDCIVGITMRHAWVCLREAAILPSPDPRMYADEPGDETTTAAVVAEGATT